MPRNAYSFVQDSCMVDLLFEFEGTLMTAGSFLFLLCFAISTWM